MRVGSRRFGESVKERKRVVCGGKIKGNGKETQEMERVYSIIMRKCVIKGNERVSSRRSRVSVCVIYRKRATV